MKGGTGFGRAQSTRCFLRPLLKRGSCSALNDLAGTARKETKKDETQENTFSRKDRQERREGMKNKIAAGSLALEGRVWDPGAGTDDSVRFSKQVQLVHECKNFL